MQTAVTKDTFVSFDSFMFVIKPPYLYKCFSGVLIKKSRNAPPRASNAKSLIRSRTLNRVTLGAKIRLLQQRDDFCNRGDYFNKAGPRGFVKKVPHVKKVGGFV